MSDLRKSPSPDPRSRRKKLSSTRRNKGRLSDPESGPDPKSDGAFPQRKNSQFAHTQEKPVARTKIQALQSDVADAVGIMQNNLHAISEREGKLTELEERANAMQEGSRMFERQGKHLMEKAKAENRRMKICCFSIVGVCIVIGVILILYFTLT